MRINVVHKARGKSKPGILTVGSLISDEFRNSDSNHVLYHLTCGSSSFVATPHTVHPDFSLLFGWCNKSLQIGKLTFCSFFFLLIVFWVAFRHWTSGGAMLIESTGSLLVTQFSVTQLLVTQLLVAPYCSCDCSHCCIQLNVNFLFLPRATLYIHV